MNTNMRIVVAALAAAALAVPAAAGAQPGKGHGGGREKQERAGGKAKKVKKPRTVTLVFKGTFTAPGTVEVLAGNAHVRKGGFVGEAVTFDFESAKVVVADANADQAMDVSDVADGDLVLVQARAARGTEFAADVEAIVARKLVDQTHPPVEDDDAGSEIG
jgi:ABC-type amino acid transport substrate-binding protein